MEELRKEQMTYRAALALVVQLDQVALPVKAIPLP